MLNKLLGKLRRLVDIRGRWSAGAPTPAVQAARAAREAAAARAVEAINEARWSASSAMPFDHPEDFFQVRDVVRQHWGGPEMLIEDFCDSKVGATILCTWREGGRRRLEPFVPELLELVRRPG
jgi:uncharacterized protein YodC (DUF2158 family)